MTPFIFIDVLEKVFLKTVSENPDFKEGRITTERVVNLLDRTVKMIVTWLDSGGSEPIILSMVKVQTLSSKEKDAIAFSVRIEALDFNEKSLPLIRDQKELDKVVARINDFLNALTLSALREHKPQGTVFQSKPDELLQKLIPTWSPKPEEAQAVDVVQTEGIEDPEVSQEQEPVIA